MISKSCSECLPSAPRRPAESPSQRRKNLAVCSGLWNAKSNNGGVFRFSRIFCAAAWFFAVAAVVCAGNADYRARFQAANGAHELEQAEAILNEWKAASPGDAEYYIAAANFVLNQESSVSISTKKAVPGDFVVADQKTGREVGSISASVPSTAAYQQAIVLLKEALSKAPARIDIYLGLATLYQDSGDPGELVKELSAMAAYANQHPKTLLYKDGKPYPEPARENLSHAISNFARRCFEAGTKQGDETFHSLAQLAVNAFPDREYGYNLMGIYYSTIDKKPRLALENYERALKLVPNDSLVWVNVGIVHNMAGEKKEAAEAFNQVIALNNDPDCVKQAQAELAKLK
jgi:tetratricopeptide (TPR) repeat protein